MEENVHIVILNSSAIFHVRNLKLLLSLGKEFHTTNFIINEIKDYRSQAIIEFLNIKIHEFNENEILNFKKKYKIPNNLSFADISIILLAFKLKDKNPIIITDDIELSKVLKKFGFKVKNIYFSKR